MKKCLLFLGKNSLLIMLTHEHLLIRQVAEVMTSNIIGRQSRCLVTIGLILLFEVVLCYFIYKPVTSFVQFLSSKLNVRKIS